MAKKTSDEATERREGAKPPTSYRIRRGSIINGHINGVAIRDGVGVTSDPAVAAACAACGCDVTEVE